ncbi:hypothetical protein ACFL08_04350 [Patescibacteria group bacterium]
MSRKVIPARAFFGEKIIQKMMKALGIEKFSELEAKVGWSNGVATHIRNGAMKIDASRVKSFLKSPECADRGITISKVCKGVYFLKRGEITVGSKHRDEMVTLIRQYLELYIEKEDLDKQVEFFNSTGEIPLCWVKIIEFLPLNPMIENLLMRFSILSVDTANQFKVSLRDLKSDEGADKLDDNIDEEVSSPSETPNSSKIGTAVQPMIEISSEIISALIKSGINASEGVSGGGDAQQSMFIGNLVRTGLNVGVEGTSLLIAFEGVKYRVALDEIFK